MNKLNPQVRNFWDPTKLLPEVRTKANESFKHYSNDDPVQVSKLPKEKINNRDYVDSGFEYTWNSDRWRCDEFDSPCDYRLLIAGDSFVLGEGVPLPNSWAYKLSEYFQKRLGVRVPYFGIGFVGAGSTRILRNIMAFTHQYPTDRVLAMLPACYRFSMAGVNGHNDFGFYDSQPSHRVTGQDFDSEPLYKALNDETFFIHWVQDILMMKMHCDNKGIPFNWTTWDQYVNIADLPEEIQACYIETHCREEIVKHRQARDGVHPGENYQLTTMKKLSKYYDKIDIKG